MNEFKLIEHFFKQPSRQDNIVLGIGDDAAIVTVPPASELLVAMDTLVAGVHFFEDTAAADIAYKSLAVNVSDIAAMGGQPLWVSLSLTLPNKNLAWLARFSSSFKESMQAYDLSLIGGDLTRGPLAITIAIQGFVPTGQALRRSGASIGDLIYVTGTLGGAAHALAQIKAGQCVPSEALQRLHRPQARVATGLALRDYATSCIDISDGLLADLGHILTASHVGAKIHLAEIPYASSVQGFPLAQAIKLALTGGDDYELCFTLPNGTATSVIDRLQSICPIHCIGRIHGSDTGLLLIDGDGAPYPINDKAFEHFSED